MPLELAIPSEQSNRVHVLALGSIVSVDPPDDRSKDGVDSGCSARKVFGRSGKIPETFRTDVGADTSAVGRRTDEIIYGCILEKRSDIWNCLASRGEYESLEEETTDQQFERSSGRLSGAKGS